MGHCEKRNFCVGDFVLTKEGTVGQWARGRLSGVLPGADEIVRNVKVKTTTGVYEKPITKIVVLLLVESYSD